MDSNQMFDENKQALREALVNHFNTDVEDPMYKQRTIDYEEAMKAEKNKGINHVGKEHEYSTSKFQSKESGYGYDTAKYDMKFYYLENDMYAKAKAERYKDISDNVNELQDFSTKHTNRSARKRKKAANKASASFTKVAEITSRKRTYALHNETLTPKQVLAFDEEIMLTRLNGMIEAAKAKAIDIDHEKTMISHAKTTCYQVIINRIEEEISKALESGDSKEEARLEKMLKKYQKLYAEGEKYALEKKQKEEAERIKREEEERKKKEEEAREKERQEYERQSAIYRNQNEYNNKKFAYEGEIKDKITENETYVKAAFEEFEFEAYDLDGDNKLCYAHGTSLNKVFNKYNKKQKYVDEELLLNTKAMHPLLPSFYVSTNKLVTSLAKFKLAGQGFENTPFYKLAPTDMGRIFPRMVPALTKAYLEHNDKPLREEDRQNLRWNNYVYDSFLNNKVEEVTKIFQKTINENANFEFKEEFLTEDYIYSHPKEIYQMTQLSQFLYDSVLNQAPLYYQRLGVEMPKFENWDKCNKTCNLFVNYTTYITNLFKSKGVSPATNGQPMYFTLLDDIAAKGVQTFKDEVINDLKEKNKTK